MLTEKQKAKYKKSNKSILNEDFVDACEVGDLDAVKYLLTSDELKEHADIHAENDFGFILACNNGHLDVIKWLIFDYNIEKTKEISNFLKSNKDDDFVAQVKEMFASRDLKEDLSKSLNFGENKSKMKL